MEGPVKKRTQNSVRNEKKKFGGRKTFTKGAHSLLVQNFIVQQLVMKKEEGF